MTTRPRATAPMLDGQGVDGLPDRPSALIQRRSGSGQPGAPNRVSRLPSHAAAIRPLPVDREPKGETNQPAPETVAVTKAPKVAIRLGKGFLRDILRVLPMAEHAECHPKHQRRRLDQAGLELVGEVVVHLYETRQPVRQFVHSDIANDWLSHSTRRRRVLTGS